MRTRAFTYAAVAGVLSVSLAACSGGGSNARPSGTKVNNSPYAAGPAAMSCTDPNIPMAEWRKRCDTATPSASNAPSLGVGDTAGLRDPAGMEFTATLVRVVDPAAPANPGSAFAAPQSGNRFVAIEWTITNTGTKTLTSSQVFSTHIVDDHGQWHLSTAAHVSAGAGFPADVKIPPAQTLSGYLVYELPGTARATTVQFDGDTSRPSGPWKLT
ncbi:MAG: DUF4352 domain-containing protein [Streptomycetaceae bacterium]|nr:DUF4352 domain-containing protein [Streptomycetaceae bacterium]